MDEFILPEDIPLLALQRSERLAGKTTAYDFRLRRSDGDIVYVHATGVPRCLGDKIVGSISVITDLTEQNNSENVLEETENKYKAIFENTGAATVILEDNSIISLANEKFEKLTGYPKEEIEGKKSWTEFVVKDDLERMKTQHRLRRDNTDIALKNYEFRLMDKTGQIKDILLTVDMIPGTRKSVASLLDITERKQMEDALKAERDRAEKYLNIAEVILLALDTRARIILLNRRGYEILGYEEGELMGEDWIKSCLRPQDHESVHEINSKIITNKIEPFEFYESYILTKNGEERLIAWHTTIVKDGEGRTIGTLSSGEDITDRRRAEKALKESEERYRNLVERANDGIIVIQDGLIKYANSRSGMIWDSTVEEIVGKSFTDYIYPDEIPPIVERHRRRMANEYVEPTYETILRRKDESKIFAELNAGLITFQEKPADLVIVRDITERKQAEEALKRSEQEKAAVLSGLKNCSVEYLDPKMHIIWVNEAVQKSLGISMKDLQGEYCFELIERLKSPCSGCTAVKALQTGQSQEGELVTPDGKIWISCSNPIKDSLGQMTGVVHVAVNITSRKQAEKALLEAKTELENKVKDRTKELETRNQEMEQYIYTVSHDLRTPLISVSGFLDFLKQDSEKGDLKRMEADLRIIGDAIAKMDRLLLDTLELSRIGCIANQPKNVSFREIAWEALEQMDEIIKAKGVKISVTEDLLVVNVDKMRLVEVLVNLIENSVKYMGNQSQPRIDISYRLDGDKPVFLVRDNGIGVDASQHSKVFELFYKVDNETEGTGAGLAIVNRIIGVHGGRIWIESELGKGCTVCFTLPLVQVKGQS